MQETDLGTEFTEVYVIPQPLAAAIGMVTR